MTAGERPQAARVVVATTVALSFISFWRGAAIVLSDLASTMFYVGGVAERAIGEAHGPPLIAPSRATVTASGLQGEGA